jgi:branched-subunit amino acid ABC-type transport system permease component
MIKASLVLLVVLCVAILAAWFWRPAWRPIIERSSPVFSLLASIATLTIFLQFYQTFQQSTADATEKKREACAHFNSRMTALASEVLANISTCNLFAAEKEDYISGVTVSGIRFRYDVASDMIRTGEITHHKLRAELMSLISQMQSLNTVIEQNMQLMITKSMADPARQDVIRERLAASMQQLLTHTEKIRSQLANTQPLLDEFWQNPQRFTDESYLRDRLIPDGLIR